MPICGCCSACCSAFPQSPFRRSSPLTLLRPNLRTTGCADLRIAVVSPFVDRRHGTERALAELLDRLARDYHCEIHLFAHHVEDLPVTRWDPHHPTENGVIFWHPVPAVRAPLLFSFVVWFLLNRFWRWAFTF